MLRYSSDIGPIYRTDVGQVPCPGLSYLTRMAYGQTARSDTILGRCRAKILCDTLPTHYRLVISCTETKHTPRTNQVNAKSICSHEAQQPMPQSNSQQLRFQSSEPKDLQNELQASGPQARGPKPASNPPNVGPPSRLVSCWAQYSCAAPASASGSVRP